jgi:hypothetical protein
MRENALGPDMEEAMQPCSCLGDPFAALPPELVPRPEPKKSLLRRAICPGCGRIYRTNRNTDLCMDCERKGVRLPEPPAASED